MKLRGTLFALAVLAGTSCSATADGTTIGIGNQDAVANDGCNDFNELTETINVDEHIADPEQLEAVGEAIATCMTLDEAVDIPFSFMIGARQQPESVRDCYRPFVAAETTSFVIAGHNQFFDQPTDSPHREHWLEALAACLPASYILPAYLAPTYLKPEHLSCYDSVYRPTHLKPLMGAYSDQAPASELSEADLRLTFDPMYQCAAFMEGQYGPEFISTLGDDSAACFESLAPRFLLFQSAVDPLVTDDEFNKALVECLNPKELEGLHAAISSDG